jgi:hypothetical protein
VALQLLLPGKAQLLLPGRFQTGRMNGRGLERLGKMPDLLNPAVPNSSRQFQTDPKKSKQRSQHASERVATQLHGKVSGLLERRYRMTLATLMAFVAVMGC